MLAISAAWIVTASGCHPDRLVLHPDTLPPTFTVLSPLDTAFDLDGDQLVDVSINWSDTGGAIDPLTARIRTLRRLNGPADTTTNLLDVWIVSQRDGRGLLVHETLANLLPDGVNRLEISVADTAGNRHTDTVAFTLPHAAFYTTIQTGVGSAWWALDIVVDSAGRRGYMAAGEHLVVFDPDSLRLIAVIASPGADRLNDIALDEARGAVYVGEGRLERYDVRTNTFVEEVAGTYATQGLAFSRSDNRLLYTGEAYAGWLGYVDVVADQRIDQMVIPHPYAPEEHISELAVLAGDTKLYMTRYYQGGILVVDPRSKQVLRHVQNLCCAILYTEFFASDFVMSRDDRHVYIAMRDADPRGVADLDTSTDSIVRVLDLSSWAPNGIGLSPSQRRLFLTTTERDTNFPPQNFLIDVQRWSVLQLFSQPTAPGVLRFDGPVAFRPDGKLIFVGRNLVIDVYLNRESP